MSRSTPSKRAGGPLNPCTDPTQQQQGGNDRRGLLVNCIFSGKHFA